MVQLVAQPVVYNMILSQLYRTACTLRLGLPQAELASLQQRDRRVGPWCLAGRGRLFLQLGRSAVP